MERPELLRGYVFHERTWRLRSTEIFNRWSFHSEFLFGNVLIIGGKNKDFYRLFFKGLYKKDVRFGPGVLKYAETNEADVGFWHGDRLVRLLAALDVTLELAGEPPETPDKRVELSSWNDPELIFADAETSLFVGRQTKSIREQNRNDPYIDKVLEERERLHVEYVRELEAFAGNSGKSVAYPVSRVVEIKNLTKLLKDIFKHFKKYDVFNKHLSRQLNIDLNAFEICNINMYIFKQL